VDGACALRDPGPSQFTTERRYVSRPGCLAEIELRLADPTRRGPVAPRPSARVASPLAHRRAFVRMVKLEAYALRERPAERAPGAFRSGALTGM
jgi:hypothetical protein